MPGLATRLPADRIYQNVDVLVLVADTLDSGVILQAWAGEVSFFGALVRKHKYENESQLKKQFMDSTINERTRSTAAMTLQWKLQADLSETQTHLSQTQAHLSQTQAQLSEALAELERCSGQGLVTRGHTHPHTHTLLRFVVRFH